MAMKRNDFAALLESHPVIAAVKDFAGLDQALASECPIVFGLFGTVLTAGEITRRVQAAGKVCVLHADLVEGLAARDVAVDFLRENTCAAGIITTRPSFVRRAHSLGLIAVQRFFLLDSLAMDNVYHQYVRQSASAVEILPGLMPRVIAEVCENLREPLIAGGLIRSKEDVISALRAGAVAVSTTNPEVWLS